MNIKLLFIAAAAIITPVSINASEMIGSDLEIHGQSTLELTAALHERGLDAEHVEAWGSAIRVDLIDETGHPYTVMLDKSTLEPLGAKAVQISTPKVSQVSGFQWPASGDMAPNSLVAESEGDGSTETSND